MCLNTCSVHFGGILEKSLSLLGLSHLVEENPAIVKTIGKIEHLWTRNCIFTEFSHIFERTASCLKIGTGVEACAGFYGAAMALQLRAEAIWLLTCMWPPMRCWHPQILLHAALPEVNHEYQAAELAGTLTINMIKGVTTKSLNGIQKLLNTLNLFVACSRFSSAHCSSASCCCDKRIPFANASHCCSCCSWLLADVASN